MEKNALSTGTSKEEAKPRNIDGGDLREFREWLLKDAALRTRNRIETHENARRNSTYLFTSSLAAIAHKESFSCVSIRFLVRNAASFNSHSRNSRKSPP